LETQELKLQVYAELHCPDADKIHISDLGSGLSYKKKGLNQLLKLIWSRKIDILVLNHKDRLLRFGAELEHRLCSFCKVEVVVVEAKVADLSFEQELAQDVIELMTVFCARLYGKRLHKNKSRTSS
jgi:predicted site-specific integrase-resolvase